MTTSSFTNKIIHFPRFFGKCLGYSKGKKKPSTAPIEDPKSEEILSYAEDLLPSEGVLSSDPNGYLYLKIPDGYIFELYHLLQRKELDLPPYFGAGIGAHISVALASEMDKKLCPEVNSPLSFTITGCYYSEPDNFEEIKYIWYLIVKSPELEAIRVSMGLSPKIEEQEFHITIAMQKQFMSISDILRAKEHQIITISPEEITLSKILFHKNSIKS